MSSLVWYFFSSITHANHSIHVSNNAFLLCLLLRHVQDALPLHLCWISDAPYWIHYQHNQCRFRCEIFRHILLRSWELRSLPWRCGLVRSIFITMLSSIACIHLTKRDCITHRLGNNLSGQYKRGVGMALHIGIGNFSGAIASNIYRTQDSPRFKLGRKFCIPSIVLIEL